MKEVLERLDEDRGKIFSKFEKEIETNTIKAQSLLRYATEASLAHAFTRKRDEMNMKERNWNKLFIASLPLMSLMSLVIYLSNDNFKNEEILDILIRKLPFIGPLIWLAYFSQTRSALYARLMDDYGHKESISISFEGFKSLVSGMKITDIEKPKTGEELLLVQTLKAIGNDPERIHSVFKPPDTPLQNLFAGGKKAGEDVAEKVMGTQELGDLKRWTVGLGTALAVVTAIGAFLLGKR